MELHLQREGRRKQVRMWGAIGLGCRPTAISASPAGLGAKTVKGGEERCQVLIPLSCFVISWTSMSPISPKSHLGWKAEVTPGGGCEPVALLREASECCISVFALPKRAALLSQVGNSDISTPTPTDVGTGTEGKGWV